MGRVQLVCLVEAKLIREAFQAQRRVFDAALE